MTDSDTAEMIRLRPYLAPPPPRDPNRDPFLGADAWGMDELIARFHKALAALGQTSGQVARRLAQMKCRGERGNPRYCPLVAYLRRQRAGRYELSVFGGWLEIAARDGWVERVRLPLAVELAMHRFDRGDFPDLAVESSHPGDRVLRGDPPPFVPEAEPCAA